jgi:hypothetical protein
MEESYCLPSRAQAAIKACASDSKEPVPLARCNIQSDKPFLRLDIRFKALIALASFLFAVVLIGCSASGFQQTAAQQNSSVPGTFQTSSDAVEFGTVDVGQVANSSVTLVNYGSTAVNITDLKIDGNDFAVTISTSLPLSVAANGGTFTVPLQFRPKGARDSAGILSVTTSSSTTFATASSITFNTPSTTSSSLKVKLHGKGAVSSGTGGPALSSVSCGQTSITGPASDSCTVTLNAAAGSSGFVVNLTSDNSAVTVPASMTVPAGATSAGFTATIIAVSTSQNATLTASAVGISTSLTLQLNASAPVIASTPTLSLSTANIAFGDVAVNTLASQTLTLSSIGTTAVTVNSATMTGTGFSISGMSFPLTLNPGQSASLTVQFDPTVSGATSGQILISSNSSTSSSTTVSLSGTGVAVPSAISCISSSLTGAGTDACTVILNAAAPSNGTIVNLSSNNTAVIVPASVTIAPSTTSVTFSATVSAVSTTQTATLTATEGGVSKSFALLLNVSQATLSAVSCIASTMTGSGTDACTATLSGPATGSGLIVNLSSSNTAVTVPASVTIPVNATSVGFSAAVSAVSTTQSTTLTASSGSISKTFAIQLNASGPTLNINTSNINFGSVTLNTTATQSITLNSSGTSAVTVNSATVTGAGFSLTGAAFPLTLNPGQIASLNVAFDPTVAGSVSGKVTISSNSSSNPSATVSLSGTGLAASYQVNLSWNAPSSSPDPVAGYNVYRAPAGTGSYQVLNSSQNTVTSYSDTTVQSGKSYDYVVKSVDAAGVESAASNITTATIP